MTEYKRCSVRDGRFVDPCKTLADATDNMIGSFSKAKSIFRTELTNINTLEPSRTYYGIKTKQFPNGMLFNNCPFCGERIDAPFNSELED